METTADGHFDFLRAVGLERVLQAIDDLIHDGVEADNIGGTFNVVNAEYSCCYCHSVLFYATVIIYGLTRKIRDNLHNSGRRFVLLQFRRRLEHLFGSRIVRVRLEVEPQDSYCVLNTAVVQQLRCQDS